MSASISRRRFLTTSAAGAALAATAPVAAAYPAPEPGVLPVRPLGMTGLMSTVLGFGGGSRYLMVTDEAEAERMIDRAIELGVRYFDTAWTYGSNQESNKRYGKYLVPKYRNRVILVNKFEARDAETVKRQFEQSLKYLGTDHIDVLHFHAVTTKEDVDRIVAPNGALKVYQDLKAQGVVRAIGVTGHADSKVMLDALQRIQPDCVMNPQNPGHGKESGRNGAFFTDDIIPYALKHGIGLLAMKTTGQDGLIGKAGVTAPELVRYAMSLPVASAIVGMRSMEVLESCAQIARTLEPMTADEMAAMRRKVTEATDIGEALPYLTPGYRDCHMA